jgi:ABC-type phosphate/phosphonate transport system substrate-binding protein
MFFKRGVALCALGALLISTPALADVNFGVMANRGELKAREQYGELVGEIGKAAATPTKLVALPIDKAATALQSGEIDVLLTNPVQAAALKETIGATPLATINTKKGSEFGGVIVANKDSGIKSWEQLKGKKVMAYNPDSAGAYTFQLYYLTKKGMTVPADFGSFTTAKKQDDIPMAVKSGMFDAGFVRTGVLEGLIKKGLLAQGDLVVVDPVAGATEARTTDLYPEWMLIARKDANPDNIKKIQEAALGIKADSAAAEKAEIKGFVPAIDLAGMIDVMKTLKMSPFDK